MYLYLSLNSLIFTLAEIKKFELNLFHDMQINILIFIFERTVC